MYGQVLHRQVKSDKGQMQCMQRPDIQSRRGTAI